MRLPVLIATLYMILAAPLSAQDDGGEPYRIFFDWGKPELTKDAQTILDEAITAYRRAAPQRIDIAAHSDRSGSASVNRATSLRRGEAVKAYLTEHGVSASAITLSSYGESRPIVATEDDVREMQNRRVEIRFATRN
jgi:OOP family OmpA-OmpF porin